MEDTDDSQMECEHGTRNLCLSGDQESWGPRSAQFSVNKEGKKVIVDFFFLLGSHQLSGLA